jgi:NADPH2:quinone reductase
MRIVMLSPLGKSSSTMLAAWYEKNGPAREVLTVGEWPTPEPRAGEVRVRLHASGVNRSDIRSRLTRPLDNQRIIPHSDGAGIIDKVGDNALSNRVGERVWIWNGQWQRPMGTAAEFIVLPSRQAVTLPGLTSFVAGACLGIPALTAFQAVHLLNGIAGKTVLVTGAASSVGYCATQIATRHAGAQVIGTVGSAEKAARASSGGAMATVDYKRENVAHRILQLTSGRGVDAIIDMDLSSTAPLLLDGVLRSFGTIVAYGSNKAGNVLIPFDKMLTSSFTLRFFHVYQLNDNDRQAGLDGINTMLIENQLNHAIGAEFTLNEIATAHEAVESGRLLGHVVVTLPYA